VTLTLPVCSGGIADAAFPCALFAIAPLSSTLFDYRIYVRIPNSMRRYGCARRLARAGAIQTVIDET
jgi:hypothetical protein